ncbi:SDR family NAD(P)-dependent oxidoreductase [Micromonospora aurantiaca (nom. illeg.)]|uniref:SDR family NAD(P)-dependent oxidoreductase n=1 Tax=Micromonospora aurantiaca (nom. illeg.) TaxID=47850 RepID=UPI000827ACCB|nr:SDR family NAD(P)-dependent oxidoreductase [Micromonospora aurantiaca]RNH97424.1 SDR family NAD(P)-dependent oxidoreductase [Micromonospora aurantiaca]SCL43562.1 NADP-dependent 3-hydroxy acid dehydrogenase YdfG [Micromonospora aurantiaca]
MTRHEERVWLVTGASRGLGRAVTEGALEAGDRVAGLARDVTSLAALDRKYPGRLLALPTDVSDRAAVFGAVDRAVAQLGGLDVVFNNAGELLAGMVEEYTEEQVHDHLAVNFLGALWVSQAVLPRLRARGAGHLFQVTSKGAGEGRGGYGLYGAGKAALKALSEALADESRDFGVRVTMLEPGPHATTLGNAMKSTPRLDVYDRTRRRLAAEAPPLGPVASTRKSAARILEIAGLSDPPIREPLEA